VTQRTLAIIKPEGCADEKISLAITRRIKRAGFTIVEMKLTKPSHRLVEEHYAEHRDREYFERLVSNMAGLQVVAFVLEGPEAIGFWRNLMGSFKEEERIAGTIRGDYMKPGDPLHRNFVHGSDSPESAEREIPLWFPSLVN